MEIGLGGNLTIINATPFAWQRTFQHSYQMTQWEFPSQINPGEKVSVTPEWGFLGRPSDDAAEAGYSISMGAAGDVGFQFQARYSNSPQVSVLLDQVSTIGNPPGSAINLDFATLGDTPFIFSGNQQASFQSTNAPQNWMQQNLQSIGCLPLNRICMPASHDSGMSSLHGKTALANSDNTLAQYADIAGQLSAGFRFFDIRPVISNGQFYTGHYSELLGVWQGGNGQSIADIISQVNKFLDQHNELVVINLSHTLDTDSGYRSLTQDQQNSLFTQLLGLKYRYVAPPGVSDLSTLTLNDMIARGPAVITILDNQQANEHMQAGSFSTQGFYTNAQFPIFNQFADSDQVAVMSRDQIGKMKKQRTSPDSDMFLLSWTLTTVLNIRLFSLMAHGALFQDLWPAMNNITFPNFIMLDGIGAANSPINPRNVAAMCMAISQNFNDDCRA
jgi:hypothetical protein